jgi:hypothetical protein
LVGEHTIKAAVLREGKFIRSNPIYYKKNGEDVLGGMVKLGFVFEPVRIPVPEAEGTPA